MDQPGDRGSEGSRSRPDERGDRVSARLSGVSNRREVRVAGIKLSGRRRRPVGAPAPLPRELRASGWIWLIIGLSTIVLWLTLFRVPRHEELVDGAGSHHQPMVRRPAQ